MALSAASRLPGAPADWAHLAVRAAAASVRRSRSDLTAHVPPAGGIGWDSGALGTARAATVVAGAHGAPGLAAASRHLAGLAVRRVVDRPDELPPFADLMGGLAGALAGVLSVPLDEEDEAVRADAVTLLVERIADLAVAGPIGHRWPMAGADHSVVGLAHGGSGVALALTAAAQHLAASAIGATVSSPSTYAVALASEAMLWEESLHAAGAGGWPDLRLAEPVPGLAWCHGAPGVGVSAALRHSLLAAAGQGSRDAAAAHVAFARARAASVAHRPVGVQAFDGSVCHGLAGVVEMHLLAAATWPAATREHVASARALATHLTRAGQVGHPTWLCGIRGGGRSPNLLVGIGESPSPSRGVTTSRWVPRRRTPSSARSRRAGFTGGLSRGTTRGSSSSRRKGPEGLPSRAPGTLARPAGCGSSVSISATDTPSMERASWTKDSTASSSTSATATPGSSGAGARTVTGPSRAGRGRRARGRTLRTTSQAHGSPSRHCRSNARGATTPRPHNPARVES